MNERFKFYGTEKELKQFILNLKIEGHWDDMRVGLRSYPRFKSVNDGILIWYPNTGTVLFYSKANDPNIKKLAESLSEYTTETDASVADASIQPRRTRKELTNQLKRR